MNGCLRLAGSLLLVGLPLIASGGRGNMITGNLLDGPIRADTSAHHLGGNISEP